MEIKGVNLGNWLVIEKWMSPELFDGTDAEDETYLCMKLSDEVKRERLKVHRDSYITARDFCEIASMGFQAVRIPVPFFLFEDMEPYVSCVEYLDKAFNWAEQYGLKILVDLHTVPGGHNGTDNSGICGICLWSTKEEHVECTLKVLEQIAERYGKREAMWGIEVLNEPMCSDTPAPPALRIEYLSNIYVAVDKEAAKKNENYTLSFLQDFYRNAYKRIRKHLPVDKYVVFSDAFCLDIWDDFFREELFENIMLDTHQYMVMAEYAMQNGRDVKAYTNYLKEVGSKLSVIAKKMPVIVGEWCINNMADGLAEMNPEEKKNLYNHISEAYFDTMKDCYGWFYWNYKLHPDSTALNGWDAGKCIYNKWLEIK